MAVPIFTQTTKTPFQCSVACAYDAFNPVDAATFFFNALRATDEWEINVKDPASGALFVVNIREGKIVEIVPANG